MRASPRKNSALCPPPLPTNEEQVKVMGLYISDIWAERVVGAGLPPPISREHPLVSPLARIRCRSTWRPAACGEGMDPMTPRSAARSVWPPSTVFSGALLADVCPGNVRRGARGGDVLHEGLSLTILDPACNPEAKEFACILIQCSAHSYASNRHAGEERQLIFCRYAAYTLNLKPSTLDPESSTLSLKP